MLQVLRFGCSYQAIADRTCSATTIRDRRDEWIRLGVFAELKQITLESYDRIVGLVLDQTAVDGSIAKAPSGGQVAGRSPVDRGKQGLKQLCMTDGYRSPAGAHAGRSEPPRLPVARPAPGPPGRPGTAARRHHRAPGRRLRLGQDPRAAPAAARDGPSSTPAPSRAREALGGSGLRRTLHRPPRLLIQGTSQWSMSRTSAARRQDQAGNLTL